MQSADQGDSLFAEYILSRALHICNSHILSLPPLFVVVLLLLSSQEFLWPREGYHIRKLPRILPLSSTPTMVSFRKVAALAVSLLLSGEALANKCLPKCKNPIVRREWRTLSKQDRVKYIDAVKCLMKKPTLTDKKDLPGAKSRYDDFLGTHIVRADDVHFVGVFYPYHRLLIHTYEQEIQKCGWKGGIPYWDWTLDSADDEAFFSSPIFDNKTGFGGNGKYIGGNFSNPAEGLKVNTPWDVPGRSGGGCLDSGPFAGLKANLGPEASVEPTSYCVRRDFSAQSLRDMSGPAMVKEGNAQKDYGFFDQVTELSTHSGGHWGIGGLYGTMTDKWASPADPLFYLHHANVDRSWWSWQSKDLRSRVYDISGPIVPFDYGNQAAGNVTMDTPISIFETERTQVKGKVWDVMHIQKGPLCYVYDSLY